MTPPCAVERCRYGTAAEVAVVFCVCWHGHTIVYSFPFRVVHSDLLVVLPSPVSLRPLAVILLAVLYSHNFLPHG